MGNEGLTCHGGDAQGDADGELDLRPLEEEEGHLPSQPRVDLSGRNLLTAAIMMALSRKPNPTKGMALCNNTGNRREKKTRD